MIPTTFNALLQNDQIATIGGVELVNTYTVRGGIVACNLRSGETLFIHPDALSQSAYHATRNHAFIFYADEELREQYSAHLLVIR